MNPQPEILLIEDDPGVADGLKKELQAEGYRVATATRGDDGLARAREHFCDVVLTDLKMPGLSGLELIEQLHAVKPKLPIIMMTAFGTTETAIEATKLGAYDYLLKPFDMGELLDLLAKAVASSRLMSEPLEMGQARSAQSAIIGDSRAMQAIYKEIGRVAGHGRHRVDSRRNRHGQGIGGAGDLPAQHRAPRSRSSRSIARPSRKRCWKANCSATNAALSPARTPAAWAVSSRPATARFFSMKSAT